MTTAIYPRVSSDKQTTRSQEADLKAFAKAEEAKGVAVKWYKDMASGTDYNRPGWKKLEADILAGKINKVVVWRLDRLGRTAGQTILLLDSLEAKGIAFVSIREGVDSSNPAGRLFRNMLASFAAYETELRSERQRAGIAAARAEGKSWGGRKVGTRISLTVEKENAAIKMFKQGTKVTAIGRALSLPNKSVYVLLKRGGFKFEPNVKTVAE